MALVESDLLDVGAISIHHMQHKSRFIAVFILCFKLSLVFIQQYGLGLVLPGRGKENVTIRQVVW